MNVSPNYDAFKDCNVIKRNGSLDTFDIMKIISGINKSAKRSGPNYSKFTDEEQRLFVDELFNKFHILDIKNGDKIQSRLIESKVSEVLGEIAPKVQTTYNEYNFNKSKYADSFMKAKAEVEETFLRGDRSNANTNSQFVSTKRCLGYNIFNKEMYQMDFMTPQELQECRDGFIYIHDMVARKDTTNCDLFRMGDVLKGGWKMGDMLYTEPETLDVAFKTILAVTQSAAAQQYGGFTIPRIDNILSYYAEKSYEKYLSEYVDYAPKTALVSDVEEMAKEYAEHKVQRDFEQGFQAMEYELNTVGSSRGDYPFVTVTFGLDTSKFGRMATKAVLSVRAKGQGPKGRRKIVAFPKLVFLYDENIHGEGKIAHDLYEAAVECESKAMYPDMLSLTGEGYVPSMYKKYGEVVSPMGCRAFLSPWYIRGGMEPADENDRPVFEGRGNIGVVSLNLPMILAKARDEKKNFYEVLDYYLEMIRDIHLRTYEYLGKLKAGCNPLMYCEGGAWGGHLKPDEPIAEVLKSWTASFGITALNELQVLYNGKTIVEDGAFALEVMKFINAKVTKYKKLDNRLYAIYGTPAESLCGTQVKQFRKKYGIIPGVSDKEYFSNSFHCPVYANISPFEKQDLEKRFWDLFNGGKIQYVRYRTDKNLKAFDTINQRGMKYGFYQGHNMQKAYCDDCGHEELDMEVCPVCGSRNLTVFDRVCGYLGLTKVAGSSRMNDAKLAEIADRKSM